jgi:hypothetical protein
MDYEQRQIIRAEAKQLLENRHFQEAFAAVEGYLHTSALSCNPDDKDKAQRIVISQQLLQAIKREITRKIDDGDIAEIQMTEIERKKGILRFMR